MSSMDEAKAEFEAEYCPLLDPALLYSILSDFDLSNEKDKADAKSVLDQLRESAILQEAVEFDPSGTASHLDGSEGDTQELSCFGASASSSRDTDLTSLSNGVRSLGLSDSSNDGTITPEAEAVNLETMDEETKVVLLLEVFKDKVSAYDVRHTLRKCNGRWDTAMEQLLNQVGISEFLAAEGGTKISNKSVDAFAAENGFRRGRKGKRKNRGSSSLDGQSSDCSSRSPTNARLPLENRWQASGRDVDFLVNRTGLPARSIRSLYNNNGASLPRTITAILNRRIEELKEEDHEDPILVANAYDLQQDFPSIAKNNIFALIHITHPSTAAAHELAKELTARPKSPTGGIQIIPRYAPPDLDATDSASHSQKVQMRGRPATPSQQVDLDTSYVSDNLSMYEAARATAMQQAQAAYRKSRSNPLMGGAAAYYSQEGRNLGALSLKASAAAADQLAARQSTSTEVDLHGIDVLNAVRIAQERVENWWSSLGENRINGRTGAERRQAGYRIVVGLGSHSVGGKSKLGPAVTKMLKASGWKFEPNGAVILVKGRVK